MCTSVRIFIFIIRLDQRRRLRLRRPRGAIIALRESTRSSVEHIIIVSYNIRVVLTLRRYVNRVFPNISRKGAGAILYLDTMRYNATMIRVLAFAVNEITIYKYGVFLYLYILLCLRSKHVSKTYANFEFTKFSFCCTLKIHSYIDYKLYIGYPAPINNTQYIHHQIIPSP